MTNPVVRASYDPSNPLQFYLDGVNDHRELEFKSNASLEVRTTSSPTRYRVDVLGQSGADHLIDATCAGQQVQNLPLSIRKSRPELSIDEENDTIAVSNLDPDHLERFSIDAKDMGYDIYQVSSEKKLFDVGYRFNKNEPKIRSLKFNFNGEPIDNGSYLFVPKMYKDDYENGRIDFVDHKVVRLANQKVLTYSPSEDDVNHVSRLLKDVDMNDGDNDEEYHSGGDDMEVQSSVVPERTLVRSFNEPIQETAAPVSSSSTQERGRTLVRSFNGPGQGSAVGIRQSSNVNGNTSGRTLVRSYAPEAAPTLYPPPPRNRIVRGEGY